MDWNHNNYTHEKFTERDQYWSSDSEDYASAGQLITALRDGWMLVLPRVSARQIWHSGSRPSTIYEFTLMRGSQLMLMPVLGNPYVERFIAKQGIRVIFKLTTQSAVVVE